MFEHIEIYTGDPILSLMERYVADERKDKINLSIGLYSDENGDVPILASVRQAREALSQQSEKASFYLPMSGSPVYCQAVQELIFGTLGMSGQEGSRIATIQTLGGSGALKIGADFLKKWFPKATVWVSDPTWENHYTLFGGAGFSVYKYPYFNPLNGEVNIDGMLAYLDGLSIHSVVLLHPCCHNPTGADLTPEQWDMVVTIIREKQLIPFLDMAYYGLGQGVTEDLYVIQALLQSGVSFLLSTSFSKIFSLYGERIGALSVVCTNAEEAGRVLGQLKAMVRKNYSSPPAHGADLLQEVLTNSQRKLTWLAELAAMRQRIRKMRERLYDLLLERGGVAERYDFLLNQQGLFSYTNLSLAQVDELREKYGIYLVENGRMCIGGLNEQNIEQVAEALLAVDLVEELHLL